MKESIKCVIYKNDTNRSHQKKNMYTSRCKSKINKKNKIQNININ